MPCTLFRYLPILYLHLPIVLRSKPLTGPKKWRFSWPTPSDGPRNEFAPRLPLRLTVRSSFFCLRHAYCGVLWTMHWWIGQFYFVQVTILNMVWRSRGPLKPRYAHFSTDICYLIQGGVITEPRRLGSATHCYLDKTNQDNLSVHSLGIWLDR